jgi:hypothetical protein
MATPVYWLIRPGCCASSSSLSSSSRCSYVNSVRSLHSVDRSQIPPGRNFRGSSIQREHREIVTSFNRFCIISLPRPRGTNFSKTSEKFLDTCLKVRSIASSFLLSRTSIRSVIESADFSNSSRRSISLSLSSVN